MVVARDVGVVIIEAGDDVVDNGTVNGELKSVDSCVKDEMGAT